MEAGLTAQQDTATERRETLTAGRLREQVLATAGAGLEVQSTDVSGPLDLDGLVMDGELTFTDCTFDAPLTLAEAVLGGLTIDDTHLPGLDLRGARVAGDVVLAGSTIDAIALDLATIEGSLAAASLRARSGISMTGARIGCGLDLSGANIGDLDASGMAVERVVCLDGAELDGMLVLAGVRCSGLVLRAARLTGSGGWALQAEQLAVDGIVDASRLVADGCVELTYAHARMLSLRGARIYGGAATVEGEALPAVSAYRAAIGEDVDLRAVQVRGELRIGRAQVGGTVFLERARIANAGGVAFNAYGCKIGGDLLAARLRCAGETRLQAAHVCGRVVLDGARLARPDGAALKADGFTVEQDLSADGLIADGEVWLARVSIHAACSMDRARLRAPGRRALVLVGAELGSDVFLRDVRTEGEVNLVAATIGGVLALERSRLFHPSGVAFGADGLTVRNVDAGDVVATGELRLTSARIGGNANFLRARLRSARAPALVLEGARVGQDVLLADARVNGTLSLTGMHVDGDLVLADAALWRPGGGRVVSASKTSATQVILRRFVANGEVSFVGAHIGADFDATDALIVNGGARVLTLGNAHIDQDLVLQGDRLRLNGELNLQNTRIGTLYDEPEAWPPAIQLRGCTYERLSPTCDRREWIARDPGGYAAQPYEQLRAALERTGDARGARDVAIASERRRRAAGGRAGRAWSRFLDWTVGYGYRPWLAVLWVVALTIAGAVLFGSVVRSSMVPAGPAGPPLQPVIFTLDMLVPVVDLHQASAWTATGGAQWLALLFTVAGWALTTAVVAAVGAAVRRT